MNKEILMVVDAVSNDDLHRLGRALEAMPLVTAGSGVAIGLPANFGISPSNAASALPPARGRRAVVSGSCSTATNRQVRAFVDGGGSACRIDPLRMGEGVVAETLAWADAQPKDATLLVYSTATPDEVKAAQSRLGVQGAGEKLERRLLAESRAPREAALLECPRAEAERRRHVGRDAEQRRSGELGQARRPLGQRAHQPLVRATVAAEPFARWL